MKLNDLEQRMLTQIEKQVAGWKYTRWMLLAISFGMFAQYYLTHELATMLVGVVGATYSIVNWAGNPASIMLLKLIENENHQDESIT